MAGQAVQVGSGYIRVIAKTLPQDYQEFKRKWQQGLEQALGSLNLSTPVISNHTATQQGQQAGQQMGEAITSSVHHEVSQGANHAVQPIADEGQDVGKKLGVAVVSGFIAAKSFELISKGLGQAMEMEGAGKKLQASLGLDPETGERLKGVAENLFKGAYGDSLEEINGAIGEVYSSFEGMDKASNDAIESMTKKALTLSKVYEVDTASSVGLVGQLIREGFVKDAEEGFDLLTKSYQSMPAKMRDEFGDVLGEYAVNLKAVGISGAAGFDLMTKAAKGGPVILDKYGDALKEFSIMVSANEDATKEAFKSLGLNGDEMKKVFLKGGPEAEKAFKGILHQLQAIQDPADRFNKTKALFGVPLEDIGVAKFDDFLKTLSGADPILKDVKGSADEMAKTFGDTLASQLQSAKNSMDLALGKAMLPLLTALLPIVEKLATWLNENSQAISDWAGPLLLVGGIIGTIVAVCSAWSVVAGVMGPLLASLAAGTVVWNTALFANPLTLWIVAIGIFIGLIALLVMNWEQVVNFMVDSINWIFEAFQNLFSLDWGGLFGGLFGGGSISVSGGGIPMMAEGGLVPHTSRAGTPVILSEEQDEIVMNASTYNERDKATTEAYQQLLNGGIGTQSNGPTLVQNFTHVDPRQVYSITKGQLRQEMGYA
jgi:hypothetical protein